MTSAFVMFLALAPADPGASESAIRLNVQAMAAPKPALKYQLLPEIRELKPGNPYQGYIKCFMEQRNFFFSKDGVALRTRYQTAPLADLKDIGEYGGGALRQADWAARLDVVDWQVLDKVQTDGLKAQLSELPALQTLAGTLQGRFRIHVAAHRFPEAINGAKTMLMLARHLGEYPAEEANLLGISIAQMTLDTLEEMLQQTDCPNLYWALTDLPTPLVDLHKGIQGNGTLVSTELELLRDDVVISDADLEKLVSRLSGVLGTVREQTGRPPRNWRASVAALTKSAETVHAARGRLIHSGCDKKLAGKLSPLQIILLDQKREFEIERDDRAKLLSVPCYQLEALAGSAHSDNLFADLLPNVVQLRMTQGRLEQRIALLRHVEALRMYAANHGDAFPQKLSELTVPLPDDPFTGKPFTYNLAGATANLNGRVAANIDKNSTYVARYELTIKK
jgi:hypothetical protein